MANKKTESYKAIAAKSLFMKAAEGKKVYAYRDQINPSRGLKYNDLAMALGAWLDESGISAYRLAQIATEIGRLRHNGAKLTKHDIDNYLHRRCSPKSEKLNLIQEATGMTEAQVKGYEPVIGAPNITYLERPEEIPAKRRERRRSA